MSKQIKEIVFSSHARTSDLLEVLFVLSTIKDKYHIDLIFPEVIITHIKPKTDTTGNKFIHDILERESIILSTAHIH